MTLLEINTEKQHTVESLTLLGFEQTRVVASQTFFVRNPGHRIRFVYTPKHSSWLNQIELWFSILVRRLLKRGNFKSTNDLTQQILSED